MHLSGSIPALPAALKALHTLANSDELTARVINPPCRKALKIFAAEVQRVAPRQPVEQARKMRSYPRFMNFAKLHQRIGSRFRGATKKQAASGAAGVNAGFKRTTWAPHGPWTALGMKHGNRRTKAGKNRGVIKPMGYVSQTVERVAERVLSDARRETHDLYMREATTLGGSPFRRG